MTFYEKVFFRPLPPGYKEDLICLECGKPLGKNIGSGSVPKCLRGCQPDNNISFMVFNLDGSEITAEEKQELGL